MLLVCHRNPQADKAADKPRSLQELVLKVRPRVVWEEKGQSRIQSEYAAGIPRRDMLMETMFPLHAQKSVTMLHRRLWK